MEFLGQDNIYLIKLRFVGISLLINTTPYPRVRCLQYYLKCRKSGANSCIHRSIKITERGADANPDPP